MKTYRIGVGELVGFLYASGDLSSETFQNVSLIEGTRAHQYVQSQYASTDQSEVSINISWKNQDYELMISGRIDGILERDGTTIIEEIKSTRYPIFTDDYQPNPEHLAQLKMYAYMYMRARNLTDIHGRVTYIQLADYKMRHYPEIFDVDLLETFFESSILNYAKWLDIVHAHTLRKNETLKILVFPFDTYRRGQREMMAAVYQTMMEDDILYAIAPTGIGKTMAALFSTLKSLHEDNQKIFYLSAKTQGKRIALESMDILHEAGLETKTLEITSKDTICFLDKRECDPEKCPFAKGFFDRLSEATKDIFMHETLLSRSVVERYARKHSVCPFEFSLFVSYYVDVIICDYNYAFDPRIHLIRYFDDSNFKPLILVDEAHNMIQRSRDMYSSTLVKSDFILLRKAASKLKPTIRNAVKKVLDHYDRYEEQLKDSPFLSFEHLDPNFMDAIKHLMKKIENAFKETPKYPRKSDVMEYYLSLLSFVIIFDFYNDAYVTNIEQYEDGDISLTLQCLDASEFIHDTIKHKAYGTVFFSATLYPIDYYMTLLTEKEGETLKIRSPFQPEKLKIFLMNQISTRYQDRTSSLPLVVDTITSVLDSKKGNYIVFFPSYLYMRQVIDLLPTRLDADIIIQERDMEIELRDLILERFKEKNERSQLAFFVMGGMFSEGIDYVGDMLNGVIVVGVGLPSLSEGNNQLKNYYQKTFNKGFDYAYTYPGMNKVIQAVGRVIRRDSDYGIAILIDDRFTSQTYRKLFPVEWKNIEIISQPNDLKEPLIRFWKSQDKDTGTR